MNLMNEEPQPTDKPDALPSRDSRPHVGVTMANATHDRHLRRAANPNGQQRAMPLREAMSSAPGALDYGDLAIRFEPRFRDFVHRAQAMGTQRAIEGLLRNVVLAQRPGCLQAIAGKQ